MKKIFTEFTDALLSGDVRTAPPLSAVHTNADDCCLRVGGNYIAAHALFEIRLRYAAALQTPPNLSCRHCGT